jgi:arylsulfatase
MIISGPFVNKKNEIHHGFTSVLDLAPTFYEVAHVTYPDMYKEKEVYPLRGASLLPFVRGKAAEIHSSNYIFAIEHYGNAMLRKGNWKITNFIKPFELENFALYNLSEDIGEQNNLKDIAPKKYKEMIGEWEKFSKEIKIQIPAPTRTKIK